MVAKPHQGQWTCCICVSQLCRGKRDQCARQREYGQKFDVLVTRRSVSRNGSKVINASSRGINWRMGKKKHRLHVQLVCSHQALVVDCVPREALASKRCSPPKTRSPIATHHHRTTSALQTTPNQATMSYLFGGGRPAPSSAEKIAAAEAEIDMVSDMFNRCFNPHSILAPHQNTNSTKPRTILLPQMPRHRLP
jgi:hypothetical protein